MTLLWASRHKGSVLGRPSLPFQIVVDPVQGLVLQTFEYLTGFSQTDPLDHEVQLGSLTFDWILFTAAAMLPCVSGLPEPGLEPVASELNKSR